MLVVLVAVSLFSVSLAHATASRADSADYAALLEDCQAFTRLVTVSDTISSQRHGTYDYGKLANLSASDFLEEFNSTLLGFGYRVTIQCIDLGTGNVSLAVEVLTSEPPGGANMAACHSCVNVDDGNRIGAARLTVTIWRLAQ